MRPRTARFAALLLALSCAPAPAPSSDSGSATATRSDARGSPSLDTARADTAALVPLVDHHKHLLSATAAALVNGFASLTADQLVAELDSAGIERAVVHSVAYWFGNPRRQPPVEDQEARVRAENDWVAEQVARYPNRLVGFCSFNPLSDYALAELERCAAHRHLRGAKLHFANSMVDVRNPEHVESLRRVFRAANERGLPILAHLWVLDPTYGREHATIFLDEILTEAPDVPVQIAHFAGGGPGYTDAALGVLAEAIAAGDRRTANLYFDIATVADRQSGDALRTLATRIRQVGVERVLFGSDLSRPNGNPTAKEAWANFRRVVPLSEEEIARIANNIAPYMR